MHSAGNAMPASYNPLSPEHQQDPYPYYNALRRDDPGHFSELLQGWVFSRYADVDRALCDPRFGVERGGGELVRGAPLPQVRAELSDLAEALKRNMLLMDPPDHTRLRGLIAGAFLPRQVEQHRARIQQIVDELLDRARDKRELDWIADVAYPLPLIVIAEFLGVPAEDQHDFKRWAEDIGELLDPFVPPDAFQRGQDSAAALFAYFRQLVVDERRRPQEGLMCKLLDAQQRGDMRSELELFSNFVLLLGAGHKTTSNLLGNAVWSLLKYPHARRQLCEEPDLMPSAVEEFLRFESPVQTTARIAREDIPHHGKTIRAGDFSLVLIGAANRDPAAFAEADQLRLDRKPNRHMALSAGAHACLGAPLARLEVQLALSSLLRRFPDLDGDYERPVWKPSVISRGLNTLHVRL